MKSLKSLITLATTILLAVGCAGTNSYNIAKESPVYEQAFKQYNFENANLPEQLKTRFKSRMAQGYNETFEQFLENVDQADGINDNCITSQGLARFLSKEAFR